MSLTSRVNELVREGKVWVSNHLLYQDFGTTDGKISVEFEQINVPLIPSLRVRKWHITHNNQVDTVYSYHEAVDLFLNLLDN